MDAIFATKPLAEWGEKFDAEGVWWCPVQDPEDVSKDPQAIASGAFVDIPAGAADIEAGRTDLKSVASPVDFLGTDSAPRQGVPALGEHTVSALEEAGVAPEIIEKVLQAYREGAPQGRARL